MEKGSYINSGYIIISRVRCLYQNLILNRRVSRINGIKSYFETQVNTLFVLLLAHFLKAILAKTT